MKKSLRFYFCCLMILTGFAIKPMSSYADNGQWKKLNFEAYGLNLNLSWQNADFSDGPAVEHVTKKLAAPFYVDAWTTAAQSKPSIIKIIIRNYCESYASKRQYIQILELKHDKDNHYYGVLPQGVSIAEGTYYESFDCHQALEVIKDDLLILNGTSGDKFELKLY